MTLKHSASGISLIEVVVALALVTIATLSVTTVGAHARVTGNAAAMQHAAWRLASELADWLRAGGDRALSQLPDDPSALMAEDAEMPDCYLRSCPADEAARFYLIDWHRRLSESVPAVRLVICRDDHPRDETAGRWRWSCGSAASATSPLLLKLGWPQAGHGRDFSPGIVLTLSPS